MPREPPSLRLLREVRRVERLARQLPAPVDADEAWEALQRVPPNARDTPGRLERAWVPFIHRPVPRAYGDTARFQRAAFFSTAPVPFTGIALRGGGEVVAFRAMVRRDFAPIVLRFAVERLWTAEGWRFPADLTRAVAFEAVLELAFAGDRSCAFRVPDGARAEGEEGQLALETAGLPLWRGEQVRMVWTRRQLGFQSDRHDSF